MKTIPNAGGWALLPFLVFVLSFLGTGLLLDDFYAFSAPVAVVLGVIAAFLILRGSADAKVAALIRGCGDSKIITMCLIYLLAGAFATVTAAMGGVEATVQLGLHLIPLQYLALGIFVLAAFLSTATGTSVGAIVALGPIAAGLAAESGISLPLMMGALLGGAMFGDNLSMISDTTIAATQTQECEMKDKFRINLRIAGPAALLTIILLLLSGFYAEAVVGAGEESAPLALWRILPYLLVVGLAVAGVNVFNVLTIGTLFSGLSGILAGDFGWLGISQEVYKGFTGMTDIFLLSMLTGGLAAMVAEAGGIDFLLRKVKGAIHTPKTAQLGIGALVGTTNMAIANNTVSIVIAGPLAREISLQFGVDKRKVAALLDIFACFVQGLLPYGAQMLILLSFTEGSLAYFDVLPYAWYLYLLLLTSLLSISLPVKGRRKEPTGLAEQKGKVLKKAA